MSLSVLWRAGLVPFIVAPPVDVGSRAGAMETPLASARPSSGSGLRCVARSLRRPHRSASDRA